MAKTPVPVKSPLTTTDLGPLNLEDPVFKQAVEAALTPDLRMFPMYDDGRIPIRRQFTRPLLATVLRLVRAGHHPSTAFTAVGISTRTRKEWLRGDGEPYETLRTELSKAAMFFEINTLNTVTREARTDPALALRLLERRFPERWGPRPPIMNTNIGLPGSGGPEGGPVSFTVALDVAWQRIRLRQQGKPDLKELNGKPIPHDPRPPKVVDLGSGEFVHEKGEPS